jgi:hypothetical protein
LPGINAAMGRFKREDALTNVPQKFEQDFPNGGLPGLPRSTLPGGVACSQPP